jgi:hypothetical protein
LAHALVAASRGSANRHSMRFARFVGPAGCSTDPGGDRHHHRSLGAGIFPRWRERAVRMEALIASAIIQKRAG